MHIVCFLPIKERRGGGVSMDKNWEMKPGNRYIIINADEPYARAIYEVLKAGEIAKGQWPEGQINFETWFEQTYNVTYEEYISYTRFMKAHKDDPVGVNILNRTTKKDILGV